jgi:RNA 3'-terminal phosphate cyclase (ATP)
MNSTSPIALEIDGAMGEGGGQVLRSALTLSICTGKAFRITRIRAARKKPGLQRQHLTAVRAARDICGAQVTGDEIGSTTLTFFPSEVHGGHYHFAIGSAGSTTLVLQTILYPLLLTATESHLTLTGGTHNPLAPSFDFLAYAWLPLLHRMGATVKITLDRHGFYPAGGGQLRVHITPTHSLQGLQLVERGQTVAYQASSLISNLPLSIAQRELQRVASKLGWSPNCLQQHTLPAQLGPANVLLLQVQSEHVTEVFTGFGQRGIRAEAVADQVIAEVQNYLTANVPVGEYLADQLLLPLTLAGEGELITLEPSQHTLTNIEVIRRFLAIAITLTQLQPNVWLIKVGH